MNSHSFIQAMRVVFLLIIALSLCVGLSGAGAQATAPAKTSGDVPAGKPEASINLATNDGVRSVKGEWRYSDTKIVEVDFRSPGADRQPSGAAVKTYDYTPHAGGADFDDSKWEVIGPTTLDRAARQRQAGLQLVSHQADGAGASRRFRSDRIDRGV